MSGFADMGKTKENYSQNMKISHYESPPQSLDPGGLDEGKGENEEIEREGMELASNELEGSFMIK